MDTCRDGNDTQETDARSNVSLHVQTNEPDWLVFAPLARCVPRVPNLVPHSIKFGGTSFDARWMKFLLKDNNFLVIFTHIFKTS